MSHAKHLLHIARLATVLVAGCSGTIEPAEPPSDAAPRTDARESGVAVLSWAPPTTNADGTPLTDLAGFRVHHGTGAGDYSEVVNVGNVTTHRFEGLSPGRHHFAVSAVDRAGNESALTAEVTKEVP